MSLKGFSRNKFFGQLGQQNLDGLFEISDDEEIKEHVAMCLRRQTPLCLKDALQNGQLNIKAYTINNNLRIKIEYK